MNVIIISVVLLTVEAPHRHSLKDKNFSYPGTCLAHNNERR
jgi:hypothetical protein